MFHHSGSRNHRFKGSNVKKILQVVVLLAVTCWLLYQVKHSREKKNEHAGNDEGKLSKGGEEIYLGRKGDAGSENVIIIDTNAPGSDESAEIKKEEIRHDSFDLDSEDKSKEIPHKLDLEDSEEIPHKLDLEDSEEGNSNNGEKGSTQEEHSDSHVNDGGEKLHLLNERKGGNSSHQNENGNEGGRTFEENEHSNVDNVEVTVTGEQTTSVSADQTVSSENVEASNQAAVSADDEAPKREGGGSEDETIKSLSETSDATSANDQANDVFHSAEFNSDTSLQIDNESSKEGEASEFEFTDNNSSGEMGVNAESKKEIENSSSNGEAQSSGDAASVESQSDGTSDAEGTANVNLGQETSSEAKVETDSQRRDAGEAGDSENNPHESSEEIEKSSQGIEQSRSDDRRRKEITAGANGNPDDVTGSDPGDEISGTGNTKDHLFNEEGDGGTAITSSEVNEKMNSDDSANEIPAVRAVGGGNESEAKSTNDSSTGEEKSEQSSKQDSTGEASEEKAVL